MTLIIFLSYLRVNELLEANYKLVLNILCMNYN